MSSRTKNTGSGRNYLGKKLGSTNRELSKPEYGTGEIDKYGIPIVDWKKYIIVANDEGFDMSHREANGSYKMEITLPQNTVIQRYGNETGHCTAPQGTPYEKLAIPYKKETMEYNEYRVIADGVKVTCYVDQGIVAPSLDSPGGAIQYYHKDTIVKLIGQGVLERIDLWK